MRRALTAWIRKVSGRADRNEAAEQLARNEQRYRAIVECQNDAVCRWKPDTTLTFANAQYCRLFGLDPALTEGRRWIEFIPEAERATVKSVYEELCRNPRTISYEHGVCLADGGTRWILWVDVPLLDERGACNEFQSVGRDITDRKLAEQALRESEERYRRIVDTALEGIWMVDAAACTTFVNGPIAEMLGYPPAELQGRPLLDFVDEAARPEVARYLAECRDGCPAQHDFRFRHRLGQEIWAIVSTSPILGEQGQFMGALSLVTNITERKRMEADLFARESLFRTVFESSSLGIALINLDGTTRRVNKALASMLGYSLVDLQRMSVAEVTHPEDMGADLAQFQRMMRGELEQYSLEKRLLHRDGAIIWVNIRCSITGGPTPLVVGLVEDITERRRHTEQLAALNRELETRVAHRTAQLAVQALAMDSTMEGMAVMRDGRFIYMNQPHADMFGYTPGELLGKTWRELLGPDEHRRFEADALSALEREGRWRGDITGLRKMGDTLPAELSMVQTRDGHLISSCRDITLALAARDMLTQRSQMLEKATRAKDDFLASMSHELRTPLAGVLMASESLRQGTYGPVSDRQNQMLHHIMESGQHLLDLLNDILNLSKIEAGKMDLNLERIPAQTACEAVVRMVRSTAAQKNISLTIEVTPPDLMVEADPRQLKQMLLNLASNAVKFTGPDGRGGLRATLAPGGKQVQFTVWDTGIGIAPDHFHKLFKPFSQIDGGLSRKFGGSGLGLALVLRMAELHGGGVSVASEPGKGSSFTLRLPVRPREPDVADEAKPTPAEETARPALRNAHILVVDDNEITLSIIADSLIRQGYAVQRARHGPEALECALAHTPDLILLDIQMPGMDGFEVARTLRSPTRKATHHTPIVALTALAMPGDRERCLIAGMNDYLSKPVRLEDLLATVRRHGLAGRSTGAR